MSASALSPAHMTPDAEPNMDGRQELRFRALLAASDWIALPMPVRRRLAKLISGTTAVVYVGEVIETRMSCAGWMLAHAGLRQGRAARREIDRRCTGRHRGTRSIDGRGGDIGAHHHAGASARRRVVDGAVLAGGEVADIESGERPFDLGERLAGEAHAQRPRKHLGENSEGDGAPDLAHAEAAPSIPRPTRSSFRSQVSSCPTPFTSIAPRGSNTKRSPSASRTASDT